MFDKRIAVLIPCYNEEKTIRKVIRDYRKCLPAAEIYVYDNNSTDRSYEIAKEEGVHLGKVPIQGKGAVLRAMFNDIDADYYITVDADDTYPTDCIKKMIFTAESENADMVIGDRLHSSYFTENKRPFHNLGNRLVRGLINVLYFTNISDIMTGSRVISKRFVKSFPSKKDGFEVETEMTLWALSNKMKIESVVVPYKDRIEGSVSKLNTYRDGFKVIMTILQYRFLGKGKLK